MADSLYFSLIRSFLALASPSEIPELTEEPGILELHVAPFTCYVVPLLQREQIILQCAVLDLSELGLQQNLSILRLLHSLNWASSVSTGITILLDENHHAIVHKALKLKQTSAHILEQELAALTDAADQLKTTLLALPNPSNAETPEASAPPMGLKA